MPLDLFRRRIPVVRQERQSECILACLAMIAHAHDLRLPLRALRDLAPALSRGGTLRDLIEIARKIQLDARAVKAPAEALQKIRKPCVLHWNFDHFVVLERCNSGKMVVVDPARGRMTLDLASFSACYTGVAVEITKKLDATPPILNHSIERSRLFGVRHFLKPISSVAAISFFVLAFSLVTPLIIQVIVDEVIVAGDYDLLLIVCGVFLLAHMTSALSSYMQQMQILRATAQTRQAVTREYLERLLMRNSAYFAERRLGTFVAQYSSLSRVVTTYISTTGLFFTHLLFSAATLVVLLVIDPLISTVVVSVSAAIVAARVAALWHARALEDAAIVTSAGEEAYFVETMRGITSVHANRLQLVRTTTGVGRTIEAVNATFRAGRFNARFTLFTQILKSGETIVVIYLLTLAVLRGDMTVGVMYVFYAYRQFLDAQLTGAVGGLSAMLNLKVHLDRIEDVMAVEQSKTNPLAEVLRLSGDIAFRNVSYALDGGRTPVIENFSAALPRGRFALVRGPTGAGKSTLLRIALHMTSPQSGYVEYDGLRIDDFNLPLLQNSVGVVLQEDTLFRGSVADNVAQFDERPDYERVIACCRLACIADEIMRLPMGYMTDVGDLGFNLSTGQQQRLLIARALYRNPSILVLDEATAHLNADMETRVLENLKGLGKTVIFASHSPLIEAYADVVWELRMLAVGPQLIAPLVAERT